MSRKFKVNKTAIFSNEDKTKPQNQNVLRTPALVVSSLRSTLLLSISLLRPKPQESKLDMGKHTTNPITWGITTSSRPAWAAESI